MIAKENFYIHLTIWPSLPVYHFLNRNGRRFVCISLPQSARQKTDRQKREKITIQWNSARYHKAMTYDVIA